MGLFEALFAGGLLTTAYFLLFTAAPLRRRIERPLSRRSKC